MRTHTDILWESVLHQITDTTFNVVSITVFLLYYQQNAEQTILSVKLQLKPALLVKFLHCFPILDLLVLFSLLPASKSLKILQATSVTITTSIIAAQSGKVEPFLPWDHHDGEGA